MIASIKTQKLLQGVRGEKPSDITKLSECIQRLSQLVTDFKEIKELDMNPVLWKRVKVVEFLMLELVYDRNLFLNFTLINLEYLYNMR